MVHFEWRQSRGSKYLYIVQNKWTPKGPRRAWQFYVGTPETLYPRLTEGGSLRLRTFPFGRTAALLHATDETGLGKALQPHLPALDPLRAT